MKTVPTLLYPWLIRFLRPFPLFLPVMASSTTPPACSSLYISRGNFVLFDGCSVLGHNTTEFVYAWCSWDANKGSLHCKRCSCKAMCESSTYTEGSGAEQRYEGSSRIPRIRASLYIFTSHHPWKVFLCSVKNCNNLELWGEIVLKNYAVIICIRGSQLGGRESGSPVNY